MAPLVPSVVTATCSDAEINYSYSPLSKEIDQIRIASIFPAADRMAKINCSLSIVPLNKDPSYAALSYTWGKATECSPIIIDGKVTQVTINLEAALRRLRLKDKPLSIWVDSICINQQDLDERSAQTAKMKLIYKKAEAVYVWLGSADRDSVQAWSLIREILDGPQESLINIVQDQGRFDQFQSLKQLFRRPYWWRIWVVQEVSCGTDVTVYCGEESISWKKLESVCDRLKMVKEYLVKFMYPDEATSVNSLLTGGPKSLKLSRSTVEDKPPRLLDLLYSHKSKDSTDPRDKVYALVGLSDSPVTFDDIDYNRSLVDTYIHTAKHIITTTQNLDVICVCQNDENKYGLPSWVPDWERRNEFPKHRQFGLHIRKPRFKAAGDSTPTFKFSENNYILSAQGYIIDSLNVMGNVFRLEGDSRAEDKIIQTLHTFADWWTKFVAIKGNSDTSQDEFQRSMCGGAWKPEYELEYSKRLQVFCQCFQAIAPEEQLFIPAFPDGSSVGSEKEQRAMVSAASLRMHAKRLAISWQTRLTCLAPWNAKKWDLVCILRGCNFPVILRKHDEYYELIGEVYVDGIMYGGMMGELESKNELLNFVIR